MAFKRRGFFRGVFRATLSDLSRYTYYEFTKMIPSDVDAACTSERPILEALNERHDHPRHLPQLVDYLAWGNYTAAWRGQRLCDLYSYGLVQHIPHKSYTAQIHYATTFAVFYFPFADPARIFRGHMLKPFYINANTRTFRSMLTCQDAFRWREGLPWFVVSEAFWSRVCSKGYVGFKV